MRPAGFAPPTPALARARCSAPLRRGTSSAPGPFCASPATRHNVSLRPTAWVALALVLAAVCTPGRAAAEDASAPAVKAAFLFNFAKFTEWPAEAAPSGAPLVLCVLGDTLVAASLEEAVRGRSVERHGLTVKRVSADDAVRNCQLLYISGLAAKQSTALVQSLSQAPTLTISDLSRFAESGGMINLVTEDGRMRFVVNSAAADRARLRLSSKLLTLAKLVKEDPTINRH
jgi:hypothetical protein